MYYLKYIYIYTCLNISKYTSLYLYVIYVYSSSGHVAKPLLISNISMSQVEKNSICRRLLAEHFPGTCLTKDVFNLLHTKPRAKTWAPEKLKLAKYFWCEAHKQEFLDANY